MLFLVSKSDVSNFAYDNTIGSCGKMFRDILHNLKLDLWNILKWFKVKSLNSNPGKFQFMILRTNTDIKANLDRNKIEKPKEFVLLGINIDNKRSFEKDIVSICWTAKYKLQALQRVRDRALGM